MTINTTALNSKLNALAATSELLNQYASNSNLDDKEAFQNVILSIELLNEQIHIAAAMAAIVDDTSAVSDFDSIPISKNL